GGRVRDAAGPSQARGICSLLCLQHHLLAGSDLLVQSEELDAGWSHAVLGSHLDLFGCRPFHGCAGVLSTDLALHDRCFFHRGAGGDHEAPDQRTAYFWIERRAPHHLPAGAGIVLVRNDREGLPPGRFEQEGPGGRALAGVGCPPSGEQGGHGKARAPSSS
ncbi:unnamed protein product, partial [Symbiodinium sp. CCMP2456]